MPFDLVLALALYIFLTVIIAFILWPFRGASPIFWYPIALALIGVGIFLQIDFGHPSDETHVFATFLATISFTIPVLIYVYFGRLSVKAARFMAKPAGKDSQETRLTVSIIFVVSLAMTVLYFVQTGTNMIIMALTSGIQGDYSTIRLAMYAGEVYTGAGYFNQFKNFLLPLTSVLITSYIWERSRSIAYLVAPILLVICILAVAGAGQRTYLVFAFCASLFGYALYRHGRGRIFSAKIFVSITCMLVGFSMMTALYKDTESGMLEPIILTFERIFYTQQWAGLVAFQFIYDRPIVWFREWGVSMQGLLPGHRGSILANEIHDFMYQSFRGTAPPTLIGSAYHNGGMGLVAATFAILGLLYSYVYDLFLRGPRSLARCFGYGALFFYLTTFFVGTIKYPFDNGVVAFWLFLVLISIRWRSIRVSSFGSSI